MDGVVPIAMERVKGEVDPGQLSSAQAVLVEGVAHRQANLRAGGDARPRHTSVSGQM